MTDRRLRVIRREAVTQSQELDALRLHLTFAHPTLAIHPDDSLPDLDEAHAWHHAGQGVTYAQELQAIARVIEEGPSAGRRPVEGRKLKIIR